MDRDRLAAVGVALSCAAMVLGPCAAPAAWAGASTFSITIEGQEGDFTVWLPDDVARIRGLIFFMSGHAGDTGGYTTFPYYRQAARSLGFGLVGYKARVANLRMDKDPAALQKSLDAAAKASGHPELANAPVAPMGFSAGGYYSMALARDNPERTIAVAYGKQGLRDTAMTADMARIPTLMISGSSDNANPARSGIIAGNHGTWRRDLNALAAFAVDWGVTHVQDNQATEACLYWIGEVARLRCPAEAPSVMPGNPVALKRLEFAQGWLGEAAQFTADNPMTPTSTSAFAEIAPAAEYKGDPRAASWLPSRDAAFVYRAFTSVDAVEAVAKRESATPRTAPPMQGELKFVNLHYSARNRAPNVAVKTPFTIQIDPRGFITAGDSNNHIKELVLYDGSQEIGRAVGPKDGVPYTFTFKPDRTGVHGLVAVATDAKGRRTSSFVPLFVYGPTDAPGP